ncbi:cupin domain-containing protein [archaeon]|nr:cupin domain-containing protein [archaeon]
MKYDSIVKPPESKALKCGRVCLKPGEEIGEHRTDSREEVIIVLKGSGILIKEKFKIKIKQGEIYYIEENKCHNIKNNSNEHLEYVFAVSLFHQ